MPEKFDDTSFQGQHIWVSENIELNGVLVQDEITNHLLGKTPDENRIYYSAIGSSTVYDYNIPLYGFTIKYIWSVAIENPNTTLAIENVIVMEEFKNTSPLTGFHGPEITKSIIVGIGVCWVKTNFQYGFAPIILTQIARLFPRGTVDIETDGGTTV